MAHGAMLTILDDIPAGRLEVSARDLHRVLPGATLIHLPGRRYPALFVSILPHGNEDTGSSALQALLKRNEQLPRAVVIRQERACGPFWRAIATGAAGLQLGLAGCGCALLA